MQNYIYTSSNLNEMSGRILLKTIYHKKVTIWYKKVSNMIFFVIKSHNLVKNSPENAKHLLQIVTT